MIPFICVVFVSPMVSLGIKQQQRAGLAYGMNTMLFKEVQLGLDVRVLRSRQNLKRTTIVQLLIIKHPNHTHVENIPGVEPWAINVQTACEIGPMWRNRR